MCPNPMVNDTSTDTVVVLRRRRFNGSVIIISLGSLPTCTAELLELLNGGTSISTTEINSTCNSTIDNITLSDFAFNLPTLKADDECALFRHINGDLSYLYRPPVICRHIKRPKRRIIHQPCWSSRRWKSLT